MDLNKGLLVNHPLFCGRVNRYIGSARGKQAKRAVDCLKKFAGILLGKVPQPNKKLEYFLCLKLGEKKLLNKTPDLTKLSTLPNQEMGKGDVKLKTLDPTKLTTLLNQEMGQGDVKLKTLDLTLLFNCFSNDESLEPFTDFECTDVDDGDGEKIPENESELLNILGSMFKTLADDVKKDCEKVFGHSPNFNWPNWFNLDFPESSMFEAFEKKVRRYPENIEKEIDGLLQFKQSQLQRTGNEENLAKISKAIANAEKNLHILNVCAFLDLGSAWLERINIHDFHNHVSRASFGPGGCH